MLASEPDSSELSPNHLIAWLFSPKNEEALLGSDLRLFLALFPGMPPTTCAEHDSPGPWENAFREPLETAPFSILFKMPITTTKLSTNENEPAMDEAIAGPYAGTEPGISGIGRDRPKT